jgi:hypothetical protein
MNYICKNCLSVLDKPKNLVGGSAFTEATMWFILLFLGLLHFVLIPYIWLIWLVPCLLYSTWRMTTKKKACIICKSDNVIPTSTPLGRKLFKDSFDYKEGLYQEEQPSQSNRLTSQKP